MTVDGVFGMIVHASVSAILEFVYLPTRSAMMGVRHTLTSIHTVGANQVSVFEDVIFVHLLSGLLLNTAI